VRPTVLALALLTAGGCGRQASRSQDPADSADLQVARADVADLIPMTATPVEDLSGDVLEHTELLRIGRDFGKREFEIALDAWVAHERPGELALVRLWWARTDRDLERSPFGARSRRHFEIEDERIEPAHWRIHLVADDKVFTFDIEIDVEGRPTAFATVRSPEGTRIERCKVERGELKARRFVGVAAGIDELAVICRDADGMTRHGQLAWTTR
jgi:hypothetical protein